MASNYPGEGRSASGSGDSRAKLPSRADGAGHQARTPALPDSYAYYAELLVAVDGQSQSLPPPRLAPDDLRTDRRHDQGWDDMVPRFGDTWT